jgi:hypothetical protein
MVNCTGFAVPDTAPLHPAKAHPEAGTAVNTTTSPGRYEDLSGLFVTLPLPETFTTRELPSPSSGTIGDAVLKK